MKNIIAIVWTVVVVALMGYTANKGGAYHGGEHGKIIKDFGATMTNAKTVASTQEKSDREKEMDALNALKEKAGNIGGFKVSQKYKSKCYKCRTYQNSFS